MGLGPYFRNVLKFGSLVDVSVKLNFTGLFDRVDNGTAPLWRWDMLALGGYHAIVNTRGRLLGWVGSITPITHEMFQMAASFAH